jgi:hypothetical protein
MAYDAFDLVLLYCIENNRVFRSSVVKYYNPLAALQSQYISDLVNNIACNGDTFTINTLSVYKKALHVEDLLIGIRIPKRL